MHPKAIRSFSIRSSTEFGIAVHFFARYIGGNSAVMDSAAIVEETGSHVDELRQALEIARSTIPRTVRILCFGTQT